MLLVGCHVTHAEGWRGGCVVRWWRDGRASPAVLLLMLLLLLLLLLASARADNHSLHPSCMDACSL
jgi:hypothetical protein